MEREEVKISESDAEPKPATTKKRASGGRKKSDVEKRLDDALKQIEAERKELEAERALLAEERKRRERNREQYEHAEYTEKVKNAVWYIFLGAIAVAWIIWEIVIMCRYS